MHSIAHNEICIWTFLLDNPELDPDSLHSILSVDEQQKAARYRIEKDRRCYILTRGILRQLLGQYTNRTPQEIVFEYNPHGKPQLKDESLSFNVSHSGNVALLAFSATGSIGVDIEYVRPDFNFSRILHRYFSAEQVAEISRADNPRAAFFQLWTLKEAFIKAIGTGVFRDLASLDIPRNKSHFTDRRTEKEWQIRTLDIHADYVAAIVHDHPEETIQLRRI